jgi:polar amino acid transport system substrate-binding protein
MQYEDGPTMIKVRKRESSRRIAKRRLLGGAGRIAAIAAICCVSITSQAAEDPAVLRLASDSWPPFTADEGEARMAVELVHEALQRAGREATTSIIDFEAVLSGLRDGTFDGSAALWRSADRERYLLFSNPYLENRLVLVGRKGSDVSATSLAGLGGKRVAVVGRYAYGPAASNDVGITFVEGASDQQNLERLLAGDADYLLVDDLLIRYVVTHQSEAAEQFLEIGDNVLLRRPLHFAVRRDFAGAAELIEGFNTAISQMLADGTYNEILQLDWIRADVDGDGRLELVANSSVVAPKAPTSGYNILPTSPLKEPAGVRDRYYVNGEVYETWDAVPESAKNRPTTAGDSGGVGAPVFRFKF